MLEACLQFCAEVLFSWIGWVAAFIAVPLLTFGLVRVEPARGGRWRIDADMAPLVGWAIIVAAFAIAAILRFGLLGDR